MSRSEQGGGWCNTLRARGPGRGRRSKLYGKIDADLKKGDTITFNVNNNFYVGGFKGTKSLVLTTLSWAGGANHFLGVAYVTVGVICLVLALLFLFKQLTNPRKLGDPRYLQARDERRETS